MRTTEANEMIGKDGNLVTSSQMVLGLGGGDTIHKDVRLTGGVAGSPNLMTHDAFTVSLGSVILCRSLTLLAK